MPTSGLLSISLLVCTSCTLPKEWASLGGPADADCGRTAAQFDADVWQCARRPGLWQGQCDELRSSYRWAHILPGGCQALLPAPNMNHVRVQAVRLRHARHRCAGLRVFHQHLLPQRGRMLPYLLSCRVLHRVHDRVVVVTRLGWLQRRFKMGRLEAHAGGAVGPAVGLVGLLVARLEHGHWGLVGASKPAVGIPRHWIHRTAPPRPPSTPRCIAAAAYYGCVESDGSANAADQLAELPRFRRTASTPKCQRQYRRSPLGSS